MCGGRLTACRRRAFLDTDVVEYVATLPGWMKIHNGETKYILKRAAARYFPDGLFDEQRVKEILDRVYRPGANYRAVDKVMVLVVFQEWYEQCLS